jgi:hypothetical protein
MGAIDVAEQINSTSEPNCPGQISHHLKQGVNEKRMAKTSLFVAAKFIGTDSEKMMLDFGRK